MKKNYRLGICLWASYGLLACTQEVKVYTTSETEFWKQAVVEVQSADGAVPDIVVSDEREQSFDGFGGSFGEIGWDALALLPDGKREEVMQALFAPEGIILHTGVFLWGLTILPVIIIHAMIRPETLKCGISP